MLRTIYFSPKPVVAKVQGDCYAGGMGLVAACDIVVASEGVNFCLSEVKLGLIPATISPYVIKAMGDQASRRYFLTAERFDAREAKALVRDIAGLPIDDVLLADTAGRIANIRASAEGREGVASFLEKRKPAWLE